MKIATCDCETDPFLYGRMPEPFVWGFFDGESFVYFWGKTPKECTVQFMAYLDTVEEPLTIYAHNGGKFDFHFLFDYFENPLLVINSRIVKWNYGIHEFRDSYAAVPVPLGAYQKTDMDYRKLERAVRDEHRDEIISYLKDDCVFLYELITAFVTEFTDKLTIASAAMTQFREIHQVEDSNDAFDEFFRQWYVGGRCQAFEFGVLNGDWKVYDVNSMYPHVMKDFCHPYGTKYSWRAEPSTSKKKVSFIRFKGKNYGAIGKRDDKNALRFDIEDGEFLCTSHEYFAALETDSIRVDKIMLCAEFDGHSFGTFVDRFFARRAEAKLKGDKLRDLFYKLILNSAYGRFGMDPRTYEKWAVTAPHKFPEDYEDDEQGNPNYTVREMFDSLWLWARPDPSSRFMNVALAASVTGAARSQLLRGLKMATRPVYCDTDSIICESFAGDCDDKKLGAWKFEASGDSIAIAGKKLYALYDGKNEVKKASKGAKISADEIFQVAQGKTVEWKNDAPSFSIRSGKRFIHRKIQSTK